jgi:hypothetical protein
VVGNDPKLRDVAAGFLDLLTGRSANFGALYSEFAREFSRTEDLDHIAVAGDQTNRAKSGLIDRSTIFEGLIQIANIHDFDGILKQGVVEAFLGQTTVHRHLTAFESGADAPTGTGHLALVAFAGGFAMAGAFSAADALATLAGAGAILGILKEHVGIPD